MRVPTTIRDGLEALVSFTMRLADVINGGVSFGYPDDGSASATQLIDNVYGSWASVSLTNVNQLGAGAGAPVVFTHNLDLPLVAVAGRAYNCANVRPAIVSFTHGDRTGANAGPAATANPAHNSVHFLLGDPVTASSIALRVHSDLTPTATEPLLVEIFFSPAVR